MYDVSSRNPLQLGAEMKKPEEIPQGNPTRCVVCGKPLDVIYGRYDAKAVCSRLCNYVYQKQLYEDLIRWRPT